MQESKGHAGVGTSVTMLKMLFGKHVEQSLMLFSWSELKIGSATGCEIDSECL